MISKFINDYKDPQIAHKLVDTIRAHSHLAVRLMEVCGTHTMSIFRYGLRELLPETITLISGPGCPVCVTSQKEIDDCIALARLKGVIIATFGDLLRVPGTFSSLQRERALGADIRIVYSTFDALQIARQNPDQKVVFLGIGFETTAPTIAAAIVTAEQEQINNFTVFSVHKTVPPALEALMNMEGVRIDAFLLPGHVSVITGVSAYEPFFNKYRLPCVVTGFEPVDLLHAIAIACRQIATGRPELVNAYVRAVTDEGNRKARKLMDQVFEVQDAHWRGIGVIPQSGLAIQSQMAHFDARRQFDLPVSESKEPDGCACGSILTGLKTPPQCPLFKTRCTPLTPVGACMVSSEGTCAAYFKYYQQNT